MDLALWNELEAESAKTVLLGCCGCDRWAGTLVEKRPFADGAELLHAANNLWFLLDEKDWLEAFACHPRIGETKTMGNLAFAAASEGEQAEARKGQDELAVALAEGNREYEDRFGFIYIVFARGRTAGELLALLQQRLTRDRCTELHEAARQQELITRLRLCRWLDPA